MRLHAMRATALLSLLSPLPLLAVAACGSRSSGAAAAPAPAVRPLPALALTSGEAVVTAMHDRYAGRWYHTLTFQQKTSRLLSNGKWDEQTWYEGMMVPGRLRIDFAPLSAANGVIYARDSQYVVQKGRVVSATPGINDLLLLGFDVYGNTSAHSIALLRKQGFDLSRVHTASFDGRPVVVVGAREGDLHTRQFWIDAERLLFVRLLEPAPRDSSKVQDIRFRNYAPYGDAWVSSRVELYNGAALTFTEDYTDIRVGVPLDDDLFEPGKWKSAKHWMTEAGK